MVYTMKESFPRGMKAHHERNLLTKPANMQNMEALVIEKKHGSYLFSCDGSFSQFMLLKMLRLTTRRKLGWDNCLLLIVRKKVLMIPIRLIGKVMIVMMSDLWSRTFTFRTLLVLSSSLKVRYPKSTPPITKNESTLGKPFSTNLKA